MRYLESHQGHARFLVATLTAGEAEPFILATGKSVMDLGGFMGGDHILSVKGLASLVSKVDRAVLPDLGARGTFRHYEGPAEAVRGVSERTGRIPWRVWGRA